MAKLSDTRIRGIKPRAKRFKLFDGEGLFLIVTPNYLDGLKYKRNACRCAAPLAKRIS